MKLTGIKSEWEYRITNDDLLNGWKIGSAAPRLYRGADSIVVAEFPSLALDGAEATSDHFMDAPVGFRPNRANYGALGIVLVAGIVQPLRRNLIGGKWQLLVTSGGSVQGNVPWLTKDAPPPSS